MISTISPPLILSEGFTPSAEIFTDAECEVATALDAAWERADDLPHCIAWYEAAAALFLATAMRLEREYQGEELRAIAESSRKMSKVLIGRAVAETRAAGLNSFDLADARQAYSMIRPA